MKLLCRQRFKLTKGTSIQVLFNGDAYVCYVPADNVSNCNTMELQIVDAAQASLMTSMLDGHPNLVMGTV